MRRVSRSKHPQRNNDAEKAHDMNDQNQSFDHGKLLGQEGIEQNRESSDSNDEEGPVPALKGISIWIVQDHKTLNNRSSQECNGHNGALPSSRTKPTYASQSFRKVTCAKGSIAVPVMKLRNFWQLLGANSDTQWYCPPDVGAIEAISARLVYTSMNPMTMIR